MDGAALLLLVSGVGVAFGWQPMPDGSPRYEYVVQVEPELAATLADGKSIPIVSDVPPEAQPIGRIRVVVGREAPPRQRLVTLLKPAVTESAAASASKSSQVELAQYENNSYAGRYASPAQQEPPASSWNAQQTDPSITPTAETAPSGQQLFGQPAAGADWNTDAAVDSVASAAKDALSRVGNDLGRSADSQLQKGLERVDSEVRGAADSFGDRSRNIIDNLRGAPAQPRVAATAPQPAASAAEQAWNQDQSTAVSGNSLRNNATAGDTWNEPPAGVTSNPAATAATPQGASSGALSAPPFTGGQVGASAFAQPSGGVDWNTPTGATAPARSNTMDPSRAPDPWANVADPRGNPAVADSQNGARPDPAVGSRPPLPFGGLGSGPITTTPQFPPLGVPTGTPPPTTSPLASTPRPGLTNPPAASVDSRLLAQPADRPLDGATPATAATPVSSAASGAAPAAPTWPGTTPRLASNTPIGSMPASTPAGASPQVAPPAAAPPSVDNKIAVLVAWVLLSGSIAGNFYLFWSYLDVRQKYRSLVRKTARAVGSRFSAA